MTGKRATLFDQRLAPREEELHTLYQSLYGREGYDLLLADMREFSRQRSAALKRLDKRREEDPQWYLKQNMLGMTMYSDLFAGGLKGLIDHLDYLAEQNITYLHLMPLMKTPHPMNDGGYAVEDFRQVDPSIGTNEDLEALTASLRRRGISLCLDLVMNHTADTHEWAMKAKAGDPEYIFRYETYETYDIPAQYEPYIPQVFPTTAPGNFVWNDEMRRYVMSSFYPYQWDLNYRNPTVFREMAGNALFLANMGAEIIRIDAVPYIWKQPGTSCRNLPQVHTIMRMIRLITEIVCPAVILKGEVVMAPEELPPYFGTPEKPECHLLYGATTMVNLWSALASRDTRLLKAHVDAMHSLPGNCRFVNYLRCHDDIGWGLDEEKERALGIDPVLHKEYLFRFYEGTFPGSFARGALYNYDPFLRDARNCGTTASLCGVEKAGFEGDADGMRTAISRHLMMYAACMSLQGFPMLSSGDEIGQVNDYTYKERPETAGDSRYIHRSPFNWENAEKRIQPGTVQYGIQKGLQQMEKIRRSLESFGPEAYVTTWDTGCIEVFALRRTRADEELLCLANFSEYEKDACLPCLTGVYEDLFTGEEVGAARVHMAPYQYRWCRKKTQEPDPGCSALA